MSRRTRDGSWERNGLRPAVWLNVAANSGRALNRWRKIEPDVMRLLPYGTQVYAYHPPYDPRMSIEAALLSGVNCLISAGGDGSMNVLLNALIDVRGEGLDEYALGGLALGSSNDFVKPAHTEICGCPVRLNPNTVLGADIARIRFAHSSGVEQEKYFLLSASVGVVAEANHLFNLGGRLIDWLKPRFVEISILYVAIKAIAKHQNFAAAMEIDGIRRQVQVSNLSVMKSPHVAGSLKYDQEVLPRDGLLAVSYCDNMDRLELVQTLMDLTKGRFSGAPKRVCRRAKEVWLSSTSPVILEIDGEVVMTAGFHASVLTSGIQLLGS